MRKSIKNLCILILILTTFSSIFILFMGKTYTINFKINNETYKFNVENKTGEVEIIDKKEINGNYIVKVKSKKEGKVFLNFGNDDVQESILLYVHKSMIITDNTYFGKSTGSEVIPISVSIILVYTLYLLIKRYKKLIKENLYQYKNIVYLGIIIFLSFFTLSNFLSIFHYNGLFETINKVINITSFLSFLFLPFAVITFILVTISNIQLIRKEGKSLRNMLGLFFGIFLCLLTVLPDFIYQILLKTQVIDIFNLNSIGPYLYQFIEVLIHLTIVYLECIFIGTIVIAIKSVKKKVSYNKDYIIILGCKIKKDGTLTPLLKGRVDRALMFRNEQLKQNGKDLIFVPSGGQGKDEVISEAEAMKNYLIEKGINEKNILVENKSKNTYENIMFSKKLINKDANIIFSTTNYHVLRAGLIATKQGNVMEGISSKTKTYFWINAFIREFIGTLYFERKKHAIVFTLTLFIIIIMILITYFANNL